MAQPKYPLIEESGTGRQWTSLSACAEDLGKTNEYLSRAMTKDIPINGRFYFRVSPSDSICWRCKNTAENKCDLFTKRIFKPPKGATYETIYRSHGRKQAPTMGYLVTKCDDFVEEFPATIVR